MHWLPIPLQRMKKVIAFFLLISHMNTSMFLPQVAEDDVYNSNGIQKDDINSVVEYIRVALGYDTTPDDEDDDSGQNFHLAKNIGYNFQQQIVILENVHLAGLKIHFPEYKMTALTNPSLDILTPPPNFA